MDSIIGWLSGRKTYAVSWGLIGYCLGAWGSGGEVKMAIAFSLLALTQMTQNAAIRKIANGE